MEELVRSLPEFDNHRSVTHIHDPISRMEGFIAIHRARQNSPAFGATRIVPYESKTDALRDALNLSRLMSYKAALAGLPYGGAKGVIILPPHLKASERRQLIKCYAHRVNHRNGDFVTGADMGITGRDLKVMRETSKYMEGVNSHPVKFTAMGLVMAIEIALKEVFGNSDLSNRTFAIQGVGKIGGTLLDLLYSRAKKIYIADVDSERLAKIKRNYPKVEVITPPPANLRPES